MIITLSDLSGLSILLLLIESFISTVRYTLKELLKGFYRIRREMYANLGLWIKCTVINYLYVRICTIITSFTILTHIDYIYTFIYLDIYVLFICYSFI
jgi:hypothetical protein